MLKRLLFICNYLFWFCFVLCTPNLHSAEISPSPPVPPPGTAFYCQPLPDHFECFNRSMLVFNHSLVNYCLYPLGVSYTFLVPKVARTGISNCSHNLLYPARLLNNCLQGKFADAWLETKRFGINSTVGILGFRDQASSWQLLSREEDLGQTFGHYGLGPGIYLHLPLLGPSTGRDLLGRVLEIPLNITYWVFPADTRMAVNATSFGNELLPNTPTLKQIFDSRPDSYQASRAAFLTTREAKINDIEPFCENADPDQSFGFLALHPQSSTFFQRGTTARVRLPGGKRNFPYTYWPGKTSSSRLIIILPGVGSHRLSTGSLALAELFHRQGYSVITFSSSLHPDFFLGVPGVDLPGDFRRDAKIIKIAINATVLDFSKRHPRHVPTSLAVMGYSLGAINTIFLAADEDGEEQLPMPIERYLAINPPVNPVFALRQIDNFFDIPRSWPEPEAQSAAAMMRLSAAFAAMRQPTSSPATTPQPTLPLTREESQFLLGFNLRLALADAICASQTRHNLGILRHDPAAFRNSDAHTEALSISYMGYVESFILPQARQQQERPDLTGEELARSLSLYALDSCLENNQALRVLHNRNDFLLQGNDLEWLESKLGKRLQILPAGGHLGNLHLPEYQQLLLNMIE